MRSIKKGGQSKSNTVVGPNQYFCHTSLPWHSLIFIIIDIKEPAVVYVFEVISYLKSQNIVMVKGVGQPAAGGSILGVVSRSCLHVPDQFSDAAVS